QARSVNSCSADNREPVAFRTNVLMSLPSMQRPPVARGHTTGGPPGGSFLLCFEPVCRRGNRNLVLELGTGLADLRRHQRAGLDLNENALGFLAVALCGFLQLLVHAEC